jgi:DNA-binding LacI/PurR family transcriptional regulator
MATTTDLILLTHKKNLGYVSMRRSLDRADLSTAVFATSALLMAGALQALYERSFRVPSDVSVVGFDDTNTPYFATPVTTVEQPIVDMGKAAATPVFQLLARPGDMEIERMERMPMRLTVRASTGSMVEKGGFTRKRAKAR